MTFPQPERFPWELDEPQWTSSPPPPPKKNFPLTITLVVVALVGGVLGFGQLSGWWAASDKPAGSAAPGPGQHANRPEQRQPSPSPEPEIYPVYRLGDHPLLANGVALAQVACDLPKFGTQPARLQAYYEAALRCMDAAWAPALHAAKLPFSSPKLDAGQEMTESACGTAPGPTEAVAMYCSADNTIYLPRKRLLSPMGGGGKQSALLAVLAHEYGHHVQRLSGMLAEADDHVDAAGAQSPAGFELSRKTELQADCFAGLFMSASGGRGSITNALANEVVADFRNAEDSAESRKTHGSAAHQASWAKRGYQKNNLAQCNTWNAQPKDVS